MQKTITFMVCTTLAITLAACGAAAASNSTNAAGSQTAAGTPVPNNVSLPALTQLLIGTFKLEDTELAITSDQATTLLPLWQAVRNLSASDTAASAEMTALEQQIQDTLTTEQMDQINAMQLTRADVQTLAGEIGATFGDGNQASTTGTPGAQAFTDGGFPPDGGIPPDGAALPSGSLTTEQQATREASGASQPNVGVPSAFVEALIQLLEAKAQ